MENQILRLLTMGGLTMPKTLYQLNKKGAWGSLFLLLLLTFGACKASKASRTISRVVKNDSLLYPQETHLRNITQLTFGGNNAEAYWSPNSQDLTFQTDQPLLTNGCDQIYRLGELFNKNGPYLSKVSNGLGRTTCSYFMPDGDRILYASTFKADTACPPAPVRNSGKYVWAVYKTFDIFVSSKKDFLLQLTDEPGYDAEATVSPKGDKIVFTSVRSGDLELWTMNIDGSNPTQITHELGYDGGAFFSPDGQRLVFRASRPKTVEEQSEYMSLLAQGLVQPTAMEIYTCKTDGTDLVQVTQLGKANWAPFYTPDGKHILFSSNHKSTRGFGFNLFKVDLDGSNLEQITFDPVFDAFPMFSPDGKHLVWSSNRNNGGTHDTNLFLADWVD